MTCAKLYEDANLEQSELSRQRFVEARTDYQSSFRKKRINFYLNKSTKDFNTSRAFWQFYSSSIRLKKSDSASLSPKTILDGDQTITDPANLANKFNEFFANLGQHSDISINQARCFVNNNFTANNVLMPIKSTNGSFNFQPTTTTIIEKYLSSLNDMSSPGISAIPVKILKLCSPLISQFLCDLFNDCVSKCEFPSEFKFALVSPLFKRKGVSTEMNNYRGISVLPPICKVFEKILAEQIRIFFSINHLFYIKQHGFRQAHSCETALHEVISSCCENIDKKMVNLLLFIDFKKAFDLVSPDLLLIKLLNYGFSNSAVKFMTNYFDSRMQSTKIKNTHSTPLRISLGVPQGSVLGPLLFLIYINDLPQYLKSIDTTLFADDTTMAFVGPDYDSAIAKCKVGISLLLEWCEHNYLYVNWLIRDVCVQQERNDAFVYRT